MKVLLITAIYPTPDDPALGSFVRTQEQALKANGVDVQTLVLTGRNRKLMYPRAVSLIRRRARQERFDVLHAHYGLVGMVALFERRSPLVVTFHGSDLLGTYKEDGRYALRTYPEVRAGKILARLADEVVVQTAEMAAVLRRNVHIVPHEVDFDVFTPIPRDEACRRLELPTNRRYLLFAAHPGNAVKRFPLAQAAARHLYDHHPRVELIVAYREPQEKLALLMSAADALVFPSYAEGSPNIVKQAMACNLPIVATDVGDVRQIVGDEPTCRILPPDAALFASVLRSLVTAPRRSSGRERVQHLAPENVATKLRTVYQCAMERRR